MLRKIALIALLTGTGQIFSILVLKLLSKQVAPEQVKAIGQIDTLLFFMTNVIALGLQSVAIRNLALTENWQEEYRATQKARFTLSLFLACFSVLAVFDSYYLLFMLAPVLALSGDYALYGRGFPVFGAFMAFVRVFFPFVLLASMVLLHSSGHLGWFYAGGLTAIYMVSNFFIARYLGVPGFFYPELKSLRLYVSSIGIGLVTISLYFIGQGLVLVIPYFYPALITSVAFVGLKFYVIYKGLLRILHQAFVRDMLSENVCLKVDQLSILAGLSFLASVIFFPQTFISLFFGRHLIGEKNFFLLLAVAALVYSLFLSMSTRSMLQRKDKEYAKVTIIAAVLTVALAMIASFFWQTTTSVALSICAGEVLWSIGLLKITGTRKDIRERFTFLIQNLFFFLIPLTVRYWMGDEVVYYVAAFSVVVVVLLVLHRKKFLMPVNS